MLGLYQIQNLTTDIYQFLGAHVISFISTFGRTLAGILLTLIRFSLILGTYLLDFRDISHSFRFLLYQHTYLLVKHRTFAT